MSTIVHLVEGPVTAASLLRQISDAGEDQDEAILRLLDLLPADTAGDDRLMSLRHDLAIARCTFVVEAHARLMKG